MRSERRPNTLQNSTATVLAVLVHVAIGIFLLIAFKSSLSPASSLPPSPPIVEAAVVDDQRLQQELAKLEEAELRKQREEAERQAAKERAKQEEHEQRRQAQEKKRIAEEKRIAERKAEEKRIAEKKAEEKRIAERKAEEKRIAERKAEEKRIAEKKAEEKRIAEKKAEEKRIAEKKAEEKRIAEKKAEEKRIAKERREAEEQAQLQQLATTLRTRAREQLLARHQALIRDSVERHWRLTSQYRSSGLSCKLTIQLDAAGNVINVTLTQSSGDRNFDHSAIAAVHRASPLPMPRDPEAAALFSHFNFKFNPGG